jgi:hypothetical protein
MICGTWGHHAGDTPVDYQLDFCGDCTEDELPRAIEDTWT